jgi:isoquinoline 1-oxidoreductase alpha subunit
MEKFKINVNGEDREVEADPTKPLLWVLREDLNLTGSKFGCGMSLCGACTVHVDGKAVRSCMTPAKSFAGKTVVTIEGLDPEQNHPVQKAWKEMGVPQCGYCQSGQIMSAAALLAQKPEPTDEDIDRAMAGNLCRCGTYLRIKDAIKKAAKNS